MHDPRFLTMHIDKVRRHYGRTFARECAYILRAQTSDPLTGNSHNFISAGEVEHFGTSGWDGSIDDLVAAVPRAERRVKAVEGRSAILAFPHEFSSEQRKEFATRAAAYFTNRYGVAVIWAVHPPGGPDLRNHHLHLLFTSRRIVGGNQLGRKTRELDSLVTGPAEIEQFRAWWTASGNEELARSGHTPDLEHRSFRRVGISRAPTRHRGERGAAIQRRQIQCGTSGSDSGVEKTEAGSPSRRVTWPRSLSRNAQPGDQDSVPPPLSPAGDPGASEVLDVAFSQRPPLPIPAKFTASFPPSGSPPSVEKAPDTRIGAWSHAYRRPPLPIPAACASNSAGSTVLPSPASASSAKHESATQISHRPPLPKPNCVLNEISPSPS